LCLPFILSLLQSARLQRGQTLGQDLLSLSELLVACPEVIEIDINPLLVFEHGVVAVDARVVLKGRQT
jgi:acetyltransferase